ncbi:hypothetical protein LVJ83_00680 [Uruburuella testudinis]|uniref:Uncharacterized protein n=1 Tax=Uruburuella testudinis TaxID=1282863 RepID=A0ABY4DTU3_9NEIS|nr:hypothetical protein [Uruburuella testudinis]UOO82027.1 hypothetical protein LVJ83_00680 [Uruburuella testudinis]
MKRRDYTNVGDIENLDRQYKFSPMLEGIATIREPFDTVRCVIFAAVAAVSNEHGIANHTKGSRKDVEDLQAQIEAHARRLVASVQALKSKENNR